MSTSTNRSGDYLLRTTPPYPQECTVRRGDLDDIVAVVDGRPELLSEIKVSDPPLLHFLSAEISALLAEEDFQYALPGHLPPDSASQSRVKIVTQRLQEIAGMLHQGH